MVTDSKDIIRCPERVGMRRVASIMARRDPTFPLELDNYSALQLADAGS